MPIDVTAQAFREAAEQITRVMCPDKKDLDDAADLLLAAAEQREQVDATQTPCTWTEDMDSLWESKCTDHGPFQFFDGGPDDNHVAFCPYCGHPITAVSYSETIDQEDDDANAD